MCKRSIVILVIAIITAGSFVDCSQNDVNTNSEEEQNMSENDETDDAFPVKKSEEKWKKELTEEEYYILREQGTEPSGSGELLKVNEEGVYTCAGCGNELFDSSTKFDSNTGWPSFWDVKSDSSVKERPDHSLWRTRTEVICAKCGGHLGHVFEDGPEPTGLRYCINSLALDFKPKKDQSDE